MQLQCGERTRAGGGFSVSSGGTERFQIEQQQYLQGIHSDLVGSQLDRSRVNNLGLSRYGV